MDAIVPYAIWAALILGALSILSMGIFSLRNAIYGKVKLSSALLVAVPAVIVFAFIPMTESVAAAVIAAVLVMFVLASVGMLIAGIRSMILQG